MNKIYILLVFLFTFGISFSQEELSQEEKERREKNIQAGNPFAKFGYKAKVATLSNGKYLEFHDLDSIVTIGSVRFHVDKMQIVGHVERDTLNPDAQPLGDTTGRWLSPDPLSEEYPDWTPYRFAFNNPLRYTDPTGLLEEDWIPEIDNNGNISYVAEDGDSAKSLSQQFGISQNNAEKITGTKGSSKIDKNTRIDGQTVKNVTGSEILKLNLNNSKVTDQDIVFQTMFAFRNENIKDNNSDNPDFSGNLNDYFSGIKSRSSATAGGTFSGVDTSKPVNLMFGDKKISIDISISSTNDGRFSPFESRIQNLGNNKQNINFLHPSAYLEDRIKPNTVPVLNIKTNDASTLLKYLKAE